MTGHPSPLEPDNKRFTRRYASQATAVVVRECDLMRNGIPALLEDVSNSGLSFTIDTELKAGEQMKIRLKNEIQRFDKEVRGIVRRVAPTEDGKFFCGVELQTRLTPLEVSAARASICPLGDDPVWM